MKNINYTDKILIGGAALVDLGSSRGTDDVDYLIYDPDSTKDFIIDFENNIDYCNANGNDFFADIYKIETGNKIASAQSLLELKCYALTQHCELQNWQKADDCEYDIKFLCRKFFLTEIKIAIKYISAGALEEINKIINNVKQPQHYNH